MMTIRELLDQHGQKCSVRCGCIGYASGFPRATRGVQATHGRRTYYRCNNCQRIWYYR